jgi:hypothetical protein
VSCDALQSNRTNAGLNKVLQTYKRRRTSITRRFHVPRNVATSQPLPRNQSAPASQPVSPCLATCQPLPRILPSIVLLQKPSIVLLQSLLLQCALQPPHSSCVAILFLSSWQLLASFDACPTHPLTPLIPRFESSFYTSTPYRFFDACCCRPPHSNSTAACINSLHQSAPGKQTHLSHSRPRCIRLTFFDPFLAYYGACLVYQSAPLALATEVLCIHQSAPGKQIQLSHSRRRCSAFTSLLPANKSSSRIPDGGAVHSPVYSRQTHPALAFATEVQCIRQSTPGKQIQLSHLPPRCIHLVKHSPCRAFIPLDQHSPCQAFIPLAEHSFALTSICLDAIPISPSERSVVPKKHGAQASFAQNARIMPSN